MLGVSFQQLRNAQWEIILLSMASLVLIVIVISFVVFYFSRRITAPLKMLIKDLGILGKEDFSHRVKIKTGDEIEEVGKAINIMAEEREVACRGLEESKETLAIKVQSRTKELATRSDRQPRGES